LCRHCFACAKSIVGFGENNGQMFITMRTVSHITSSALRVGAGLLLSLGIVAALTTLSPLVNGLLATAGALGLIAGGMWLGGVMHSKQHDQAAALTCWVLTAAAVATLAWAAAFSSQQGSDFGVYFRCGLDAKSALVVRIERCSSQYITYGDIYWHRSLLYTVPIAWLSNGSYSALKFANATFQILGILVVVFAVKKRIGAPAALVAAAAFAIMHERYFMLTLATTDNLAFLASGVGVLAMAALWTEKRPRLWACLLGFCIIVLQFSRSTGILVGLSVLLLYIAVIRERAEMRAAGITALALFATVLAIGAALAPWQGARGLDGDFLKRLSALDLTTTQNFTANFAWFSHFWPSMPEGERTSIAISKVLQELAAHGSLYPAYVFVKAQALFSGFGYTWFAAADLSGNADTFLTVNAGTVPKLPLAQSWMGCIAQLPMLALAAAGAFRARPEPLPLAALCFLVVGMAAMLCIGESQPRYLIIFAPAIAILCAEAVQPCSRTCIFRQLTELRTGALTAAVATIISASAIAATALTVPLPLRSAVPMPSPDCPVANATMDGLRLSIAMPAGASCARAAFVAPVGKSLGFFVSSGVYQYRNEPFEPTGLAYRVQVDGGASIEGSLDQSNVVWRTLPLAGRGERIEVFFHRPAGSQRDISASLSVAIVRN
jgi:hypothetical protein